MKKSLLITTSLLMLSGLVKAQTTLTSTDLNPAIGDAFHYNSCTFQTPTSGGANQIWNYSALVSTGTYTNTHTAPNAGNFPTANIAVDNGNGSLHYNNTTSGQELVGIMVGSTVFTYSNGEVLLPFPLVYNTTSTDNFRASFVSGVAATRTGSNSIIVDAYGTLTLPGNNSLSDVLRVHLTQTYIDSLDLGSGFYYEINYTSSIYFWYRAGYKSPLLSFSTLTTDGSPSESGYYTNDQGLGVESIDGIDDVVIMGNPFVNELNFVVNATRNKNLTYQLMDVLGNTVFIEGNSAIISGSTQLGFNTSNIASGIYCLRITDGNTSINKLIIKQ